MTRTVVVTGATSEAVRGGWLPDLGRVARAVGELPAAALRCRLR